MYPPNPPQSTYSPVPQNQPPPTHGSSNGYSNINGAMMPPAPNKLLHQPMMPGQSSPIAYTSKSSLLSTAPPPAPQFMAPPSIANGATSKTFNSVPGYPSNPPLTSLQGSHPPQHFPPPTLSIPNPTAAMPTSSLSTFPPTMPAYNPSVPTFPTAPGSFPPSIPQTSQPYGQPQQPPSGTQFAQPISQPAPGYYGHPPPTASGQPPQPALQQQAPRRLDPDQMPSPIQVQDDDIRARNGVFDTNERGALPPLVTTDFVCTDQGNANPRFVRSTVYNIPATNDLAKQTAIPIGLVATPFADLAPNENPPPLVDMGEMGPVRCNRCKAYMCPFMAFIDGGRRFQCTFCSCVTDVPEAYFNHLDHTGSRVDRYQRAELCLGSYEYVATKEYCKNNELPNAPVFIFMIDVSYNSVRSGLLSLLAARLKQDVLVNLPREAGAAASEIHVGFVTFNRELHFYNVKATLTQPQMFVVSDIDDVFLPLLDGFLVRLDEAEETIDSLLSQLPSMFEDTRETEVVLGPAIQAGLNALKAARRPGKLFVFNTSLPTTEGPGKLKNREDRKLIGTENEKTLLAPQTDFYGRLGGDCVQAGCAVDLFLFPNSFVDVATIGDVCARSGGHVHKFTYFQADIDGDLLMETLRQNVERSVAFDAILRVRLSTGIRATDFYGNLYMENATDVECGAMDSGSSVSVEIKHDDKLPEGGGAFAQVATLYTSVSGQRRLRLHNLSLNCTSQLGDIYRSCELDTLVNLIAKKALQHRVHVTAMRDSLQSPMSSVTETLTNTVSTILACYRKHCASPSAAGQLILPEAMKLLPLYTNCLLKTAALASSADGSIDERAYHMHRLRAMGPRETNVYFYPRLYPLRTVRTRLGPNKIQIAKLEIDLLRTASARFPTSQHELSADPDDPDGDDFPLQMRCSVDRLADSGAYVLDNGLVCLVYVGLAVDSRWVQEVFGVSSISQLNLESARLVARPESKLSERVVGVVETLQSERQRPMKLMIVRQNEKLEHVFNQLLAEDRSPTGVASYVDYLCHIHKEIRNILK